MLYAKFTVLKGECKPAQGYSFVCQVITAAAEYSKSQAAASSE